MIIGVDEAPAIALLLLNEKLSGWQKTVPPSWPSTWAVFNRLIERHDEMASVYREISTCSLTRQQLWVLLEQIIHAGSFRFAKLRADHQELAALNDNISTMSMQLAEMLERRTELVVTVSFIASVCVNSPNLLMMPERGTVIISFTLNQNCSDLIVSILSTGLTWPGLFVRWVWSRLRLHLLMKRRRR